MHKHHKTKGLRIDIEITDPHTNQTRWIDVTVIHPTCKTRIKRELKHRIQNLEAEKEARQNNEPNKFKGRQGYAVMQQTKTKHDVYEPLISIAEKQFQSKRRVQRPIFWAGVASALGEFGPETIKI